MQAPTSLPAISTGAAPSPRHHHPLSSHPPPGRPTSSTIHPLSLLPHCRGMEDLRAIQAGVIKSGGLHDDAHFSLSKLIEFCALSPGGDLSYALLLFNSVPEPHHFLWNTVIRGYSLSHSPVEAVVFYVRMLLAGTGPNSYTFPFLLKACTAADAIREGRQVHAQVLKLGFASDAFVHTSLITMYARNGEFHSPVEAVVFYVRMLLAGTGPNSYTFPFLLKACTAADAIREGRQVHAQVLKLGFASDAFVHTSLITMYARNGELCDARRVFDVGHLRDVVSFTALIKGYVLCGQLDVARRLFDVIPTRDVVSWNTMIAGYAQSGRFAEALYFFQEMLEAKIEPDESTMVSVLSACAQSGSIRIGTRVHHWMDECGLESNTRLANALVDMYSKCGDLETACALFDKINKRDQVSWNVMIGGYSQMRGYKETLALFRQMQLSNVEPNEVTFLNILPACAHLGALDIGIWIHCYIDRRMGKTTKRTIADTTRASLFTSLIDMYAKCGSVKSAEQVFNDMPTKKLSSWNALIAGLAMHGQADKALRYFERMTKERLQPDDITFVGVLSACSHAGLVETGQFYFDSMVKDYNISPKVHHYGCMVDLFGRAGLLKEAELLIKKMEVKADVAIWGSLLGACCVHHDVKLAEFAADHLIRLEPENTGVYALLSNVYAAAGKWDEVARVRTSLKDKGMKKVPGSSSIEVDGVLHEFLVGDKIHPQSKEIYQMLDEITTRLQLAGHVPDTSIVLYDIEDEWKEGTLCYHSEKLALAFGLITTSPGTTIRIVKNLRVCGNCHSELKLISKLYNREIITRDRSRFHHLKNGRAGTYSSSARQEMHDLSTGIPHALLTYPPRRLWTTAGEYMISRDGKGSIHGIRGLVVTGDR
ncbi:hypothetical protein Taro_029064 [Colocasia esculenta]|uniref:DYW domain-containing protein n=1 Tax=Colocasia esculenta TaxID=4460 RepID=A0A843VI18_COLES|nr:hypothetical protein [Colocasia esculenta]